MGFHEGPRLRWETVPGAAGWPRLARVAPWVVALALVACGDDDQAQNDVIEDGTSDPDGTNATGSEVSTSTATDATSVDGDATIPTDGTVTDPDATTTDPVDGEDATATTTTDTGTDVPTCPAAPTTPCEASNGFGTCSGAWTCVDTTWTCDARTPAAETCDGVDNNCNGATDEGFKNPVTNLYDRDDHCGSCTTDCTTGLGPDEHAYGRCDASGAPTCQLVCCTADAAHPSCDGSDWQNGNGQPGDGCEARVVRTCTDENGCPQSERCVDQVCVPNPPGGPCTVDGDCAVGDACFGGICGCAGDVYTAEAVPPNVLIVLDRSSSMNEEIGGSGVTKWEAAKDAVEALTNAYDAQVRFGLKLFPGIDQAGTVGSECGPGVVWVDTGDANAGEINTFLGAAGTSSGTPIYEALSSLIDYDGLEDTTRNNYVILITDGEANCEPPVPAVEALLDEDPSIRTFVIGFGDGVDPQQLSDMAEAGDTALPGDPSYYQADNPLSLGEALTTIVGNVLGCTYVLGDVPPSGDELSVYFDLEPQPADPTQSNGWTYSAASNQVTFHGPMCDSVLAGTVEDLVFVYGCPSPIIIGDP